MKLQKYIEEYIFEQGSNMSPQYFDAVVTLLKEITM